MSGGRARLLVWILVSQFVLWCLFAWVSQGFVVGGDLLARPFGTLGLLTGGAFFLYLIAAICSWNEGENSALWSTRRLLIWSIALRLPLVFCSQPVQEIDYFRYLWDGRVVLQGISPYQYSPDQIDEAWTDLDSETDPDLNQLWAVLKRSESQKQIFENIDHRRVPTIYPVVSQCVFATAAFFMPEDAPIFGHLIMIRSLLALFDLGIIILLLLLLRHFRLPQGRAVAYAFCPLVLKEFANSAHMDVIAIFFVVASFYLLARWRHRLVGHACASVLLTLAILAKWFPVILVPLYCVHTWRKFRWKTIAPIVAASAVFAVGMMAMRPHPSQHDESTTGLRTFLQQWEMNDLLFAFVYENLRDDKREGSQPWFVVTTQSAREGWCEFVRKAIDPFDQYNSWAAPAFLTSQAVCGGLIGLVILWMMWRRSLQAIDLGYAIFMILAISWYCSATQNPWYWAWCLPFVIFSKSRIWLLVSGTALIYYMRFWLIYHHPDSFALGLDGFRFFDEVVVWLEHFPMLCLLAIFTLRGKRRRRQKSHPE